MSISSRKGIFLYHSPNVRTSETNRQKEHADVPFAFEKHHCLFPKCKRRALAGVCGQGARADAAIPVLSGASNTAWMEIGDELLPPASGAIPLTNDPRYPYVDTGKARRRRPFNRPTGSPTCNNPILRPWAKEEMRKANDEVRAGKVPFRPRKRCYRAGVPGYVVFTLVMPFGFIQTPKKVTGINQGDAQIRNLYGNVPYVKGDTLVVDTVGISRKSFVDNYRAAHQKTACGGALQTDRRRQYPARHDHSRGPRHVYHAVVGVAVLAKDRPCAGRRGMRREQFQLFQLRGSAYPAGRQTGFLKTAALGEDGEKPCPNS